MEVHLHHFLVFLAHPILRVLLKVVVVLHARTDFLSLVLKGGQPAALIRLLLFFGFLGIELLDFY